MVSGLDTADPGISVALTPGTPVEVRRRFDNRWAHGFVIASASSEGYILRRNSDGSLLPVAFRARDLRPQDAA